MTREEVIRLSYAANDDSLTIDDVSVLLMQYCIENGKSYRESTMFIRGLSEMPELMVYYTHYALEWYQRKYTIIKLYSIPDSIGSIRIILIY